MEQTRDQYIMDAILNAKSEQNEREKRKEERNREAEKDEARKAKNTVEHLRQLKNFYYSAAVSDNPGIDKTRYMQDSQAIEEGIGSIEALIELKNAFQASSENDFSKTQILSMIDYHLGKIFNTTRE